MEGWVQNNLIHTVSEKKNRKFSFLSIFRQKL